MAGQALDEAEAIAHPMAPAEDILAALRGQNLELARIASEAVEARNAEQTRADQISQELGHAKTQQAQIERTAQEAVSRARNDAQAAIAATQAQAKVAERAAVAAGAFRQAVGAAGALLSFLIDRAPVLLTLLGAYFLARDILPAPSVTQLVLLGTYGMVAVAPAVWISVRRG